MVVGNHVISKIKKINVYEIWSPEEYYVANNNAVLFYVENLKKKNLYKKYNIKIKLIICSYITHIKLCPIYLIVYSYIFKLNK